MDRGVREVRLTLVTFGVVLLAIGLFARAGWPFVFGGLVVLVGAARSR